MSSRLVAAPFAMSEGIANEVGTAFGLWGQSVYHNGTAPNPGNVMLAPIMGNSQVSRRGLWWNGNVLFFFNPTTGVVTGQSQDDMSLLASKFGYRADGIGNALSTASPLAVSGSTLTGSGIIAQTTESDYFSFTTTGGQVTLNGNAAQYGAMLTPKLTLFNSAGQQIGLADAGTAGESLTMTLASGTYYVSVSGHGMIPCYNSAGTFVGSGADVGQYTLSVTAPTVAQVPAVVSTKVGDGSIQRSSVKSFSITFNEAVNFSGSSFTLYKATLNPNGSVAGYTTDVSSGVTVTSTDNVTWTFTGITGGILDRNSSNQNAQGFFSDGVYELVLHGRSITDRATGTAALAADDQIASFANSETIHSVANGGNGTAKAFHVLYGDLNGDGIINNDDLNKFKQAFSPSGGTYNAAFDFINNGTTITNSDLSAFNNRFLATFTY